MNSKVTALIPIKIFQSFKYELFKQCFLSYLPILKKHNVVVKIANESSDEYKILINKFIKNCNISAEMVESSGYVDAVQKLIQSVENEYFFFIVDDVELLNHKDFITPSLGAFGKNENLIQIKFGGGHSARKTKKQNLSIYENFYRKSHHDQDIVWINTIMKNQEKYIFSHYNCILRSDVFKKVDKEIVNHNIKNWDDYVLFLKANFLKELGHYETGWLNFEDYLYTWYRSEISKGEAIMLIGGER